MFSRAEVDDLELRVALVNGGQPDMDVARIEQRQPVTDRADKPIQRPGHRAGEAGVLVDPAVVTGGVGPVLKRRACEARLTRRLVVQSHAG